MKNFSFGKSGENIARVFLEKNNYKILDKNFRTRYGEIDIIAKDGSSLVFIEVKSRKTTAFGFGREAITAQKQQKIKACALWYLKTNKTNHKRFRFDVVEIFMPNNNETQIKLIKSAF